MKHGGGANTQGVWSNQSMYKVMYKEGVAKSKQDRDAMMWAWFNNR